jgi:hypothetical protein
MAEAEPSAAPPGGTPAQNLEERWQEAVDALTESPRDVDLLVKAGQIAEQLGYHQESYTYYRKALLLDPTRGSLIPKLRPLASTPEQKAEIEKIARLPESFQAGLGDVFRYPVRGKGLPVLLLGALLLWLARGLMGSRVGSAGIGLAGFVAVYMAVFYIEVCHSTVLGDDQLPEWPDPTQVSDFLSDAGKFYVAKIVSFFPVIVVMALIGFFSAAPPAPDASVPAPSGIQWRELGVLMAVIAFGPIGVAYLPMAILSNVVLGSPWTCLHVPFVARSMLAAPRDYVLCVVVYLGTFTLIGGAELVAKLVGILPTGLALGFLELYGMTLLMRLTGHFYRMNQARLAWLGD